MSVQFDVSLGYREAVSGEVITKQQDMVQHWAQMPSALANAKLHAQNELNRLITACNRAVWGGMPAEMRQPSPGEIDQVLQGLSDQDRATLLNNCRLAAEQRHLMMLIEAAESEQQQKLAAEEAALAAIEAEARERAEFEAIDAAGKDARFEAWRASRS